MFSNQNRNRGRAESVKTPITLKGDAIGRLRTKFQNSMKGIAAFVNGTLKANDRELQKFEDLLKKDEISKSEFQKIYRRQDNITVSYHCYDNILDNITKETIDSYLNDVRKDAQKIDAELDEIAEGFGL